MASLRRRLLMGTAAGSVVVLAAAGISLHAAMRASLLDEFDKALSEKATTLSAMVEQDAEGVTLEFTESEMGDFLKTHRPEYFQVWREDGTVVGKAPSLGDADLMRETGHSQGPVIRALELPNATPGRQVTLHFIPRLDDESPDTTLRSFLTLALARDMDDVTSSLNRLRSLLMAVGAAATLVSAGVLAWLVHVGLKPVDRLAHAISLIDEGRLSAGIDSRGSPRELRPVVDRLNELLQRLNEAFLREKTLTANVAHELRTPLAGIRSTLEVALSRPRDPESMRQVMSDCLQICSQTQRLIENLLAMARLEADIEPVNKREEEVGSLLRQAWKPFDELARQRALAVRWEVEPDLHVETDPEKLGIVFSNVFENAARYADQGGSIAIQGSQSDGCLRICVSNSGSTLSAEEAARVFDPFWRGDHARSAAGTHCGLGLSLCKTIVGRLGGTIHAEAALGGRFSVILVL